MPDALGDDLTLGKDELAALDAALRAAFPDLPPLKQMVLFGLGVNLPDIVPTTTLQEAVFELIAWAAKTGQVRALVQAAVNANPDHPGLRAFATRHAIFPAPAPNPQSALRTP